LKGASIKESYHEEGAEILPSCYETLREAEELVAEKSSNAESVSHNSVELQL
jgi:hypothetical protein